MDRRGLYLALGGLVLAAVGLWYYTRRARPPNHSPASMDLCGTCRQSSLPGPNYCNFETKNKGTAQLRGCNGITDNFMCADYNPIMGQHPCPYQYTLENGNWVGNWRWQSVVDRQGCVVGCRPPADGTVGSDTKHAFDDTTDGLAAPYAVALFKNSVDMPISAAVNAILHDGAEIDAVVAELLARPFKTEVLGG